MPPYRYLTFQNKRERERKEPQKIVRALVQRNLITIKLMDSVKNTGHAEVALFFESFRAPFYRKRKIEKREWKKREENIREHSVTFERIISSRSLRSSSSKTNDLSAVPLPVIIH